MDKIDKLAKAIISSQSSESKTSPYDTTAEVVLVEGGTAWVKIAGGVDRTPAKLLVDAKKGDSVRVHIAGGNAYVTGNATAPPTDDTKANVADAKATEAKSVAVDARDGATKAKAKADAASETAETAAKTAEGAHKIAGNTNQYFWHTESGTDTGAHITEIPRERFLADPDNGGGNLLARSNGIAVRDGLTELATFGADGTTIYQDGNAVAVIEKGTYDGTGRIGLGSLLTSAGENRVSIYDRSILNASTGRFRTVYKDTTMSSSTVGYVEVGATNSGGSVRLSAEGAGSESGSLHLYASSLYPRGRLDLYAGEVTMYLDTTAASGTDHDLYAAITALGWQSEVIV